MLEPWKKILSPPESQQLGSSDGSLPRVTMEVADWMSDFQLDWKKHDSKIPLEIEVCGFGRHLYGHCTDDTLNEMAL
jgi:hypothetical protein